MELEKKKALTMRALVAHAAKDIRIETVEVEPLGPQDLRIALRAGGICGSDLHYYNHGGFGAVRLKQPMILGHEVAGVVEAVGSDVTSHTVGDLVAVSPSRPCYSCDYCQRAQFNHCENMRFYGSAMPFPHIQGAFRETLIAHQSQCVIANGLSAELAALAEPFAVTLHAAKQAGNLLGKHVLVTGCGPIGCLTIAAAKLGGAAEIIATDLTDETLAIARQLGATETINVADNPEQMTTLQAGKGTVDVLFECSGAQVALAAGLAAVRPRGTVVQLGLGGDMTLPMMMLTAKELTLTGSFRFHEEFATAVATMQAGHVDLAPLISHSLPLDDAVAAFELANDRRKAMKVQLQFGG